MCARMAVACDRGVLWAHATLDDEEDEERTEVDAAAGVMGKYRKAVLHTMDTYGCTRRGMLHL